MLLCEAKWAARVKQYEQRRTKREPLDVGRVADLWWLSGCVRWPPYRKSKGFRKGGGHIIGEWIKGSTSRTLETKIGRYLHGNVVGHNIGRVLLVQEVTLVYERSFEVAVIQAVHCGLFLIAFWNLLKINNVQSGEISDTLPRLWLAAGGTVWWLLNKEINV